jgi:hypothetical protein
MTSLVVACRGSSAINGETLSAMGLQSMVNARQNAIGITRRTGVLVVCPL